MRLKSANSARDNVTETDIEDFFVDEELRGEFIVLSQDGDNYYIQSTGEGDEGYELEYRDGSGDQHYRATTVLSKDEVKEAFLDYLHGRSQWRTRWTWEKLDFSESHGRRLWVVVAVVLGIGLLFLLMRYG